MSAIRWGTLGHPTVAAEILGPIVKAAAAGDGRVADTDVTEFRAQNIGPVPIAGHPGVDH